MSLFFGGMKALYSVSYIKVQSGGRYAPDFLVSGFVSLSGSRIVRRTFGSSASSQ